MSEERLSFQAEVSRLLRLMVNSVYSNKEVFLRELISNASDACDKLRYQALAAPELAGGEPEFRVRITADAKARTLTVDDNGIGMSRDELVGELGTIARSGTHAFLEQLSGNDSRDLQLIGQFGVGFYSAFMVADRVDVISRRAGAEDAWRWSSDGGGEFTVAPAERAQRGTTVILHLREGEAEWLETERLRRVVKMYSDHIALPIRLVDGEREETLNEAAALWVRPKREISEEQYREFYRHVAHAMDEPWLTLHYRAEGKIEYAVLLFVPSRRPYDLFDPARQSRVKLYVRRVFITDECEGLLPPWLRFLRGVVDSEDLPLNISREMLQSSPVLARIKSAVTKRILGELARRADKDADGFAVFWDHFGAVLKEGIYEDAERRDDLLKLARFRSTAADGLTGLADYVARMKPNQTAIYYITGDDAEAVRRSPHLEGFRARGVEVLLLSDPVDDFWLGAVEGFDGKPFRSVTRGGAELKDIKPEAGEGEAGPGAEVRDADLATLIALLKQHLGEAVKDVRTSDRLTDSPVCLVADDGALDLHLERMLKAHRQLDQIAARILEINPRHALIHALAARVKGNGGTDELADAAHLLLDQARIVEGEPLPDPAAFSRRLAAVMERGLGA